MPSITIAAPEEAKAAAPKNHVLSNVTATILARVGYMVTRVMIPPFVIAHMSLQEYGVWTSAFILVSYLGVSTMGVSNVYIRYTAKYEAEGDFRAANELLSTGLFVTIPMCAGLFGLLVIFWHALAAAVRLPPQMAGDAKEAVYLVVLVFLSSISLCAYGDALSGVQRIDIGQKIWVAGYLLETVLIFVFVGMGRGVRGMAEAFFVRTLLGIILSVIVAYRVIPWLKLSPRLVSRRAMRDLVSFGSAVQIQCLLDVVLNSAERVVALMVAGFGAAGLLDIAKKMPASVSAIPLAFASAFLPAASRLEASSADDERSQAVRDFYLSGAKFMNMSSAYFCAFLALLAFPILHVWMGKELPFAGALLTVFAVSMQVHLLTGPGTSITKGIGKPSEEFHYCIPNLIALAIFVPLSKLFSGGFTALTIGLCVAASTIVSALYFLWRMDRELGVPHADYLRMVIFPGCVPYLLATPLALILRQNNLLQAGRLEGAAILAACGVVYTALFAAFTYTQVLSADQKIYVKDAILKYAGGNRLREASTAQLQSSGGSDQ